MSVTDIQDYRIAPEVEHPLADLIRRAYVRGHRTLLERGVDVWLIDTSDGRVERVADGLDRSAVERGGVRREIAQPGSVCLCDGGRAVCVLELDGDGGYRVACVELASGAARWARRVAFSPAFGCEAALENGRRVIHEERERAFLIEAGRGPVLVIDRSSTHTVDVDSDVSVMNEGCQGCMELWGLSGADGESLWRRRMFDTSLYFWWPEKFDGSYQRGDAVGFVDLATGAVWETEAVPGHATWPVRFGSGVLAAYVQRGGAGLAWGSLNEGSHLSTTVRKRPRVRSVTAHVVGDHPMLQINDQILWRPDLEGGGWEARTPPWVYGVAGLEGGPVFVMTAGGGGRLFAFEAESGRELLNVRPALGGFANTVALEDQGLLVSSVNVRRDWSQRGLHVADMRNATGRMLDCGGHIVGAGDGRVVVTDPENDGDLDAVRVVSFGG